MEDQVIILLQVLSFIDKFDPGISFRKVPLPHCPTFLSQSPIVLLFDPDVHLSCILLLQVVPNDSGKDIDSSILTRHQEDVGARSHVALGPRYKLGIDDAYVFDEVGLI